MSEAPGLPRLSQRVPKLPDLVAVVAPLPLLPLLPFLLCLHAKAPRRNTIATTGCGHDGHLRTDRIEVYCPSGPAAITEH